MSTEIWRERGELDRARREFMKQAMAEYDKTHYEKLRALQARCSHENERFTHFGPFGNPWLMCTSCHRSRTEIETEAEESP